MPAVTETQDLLPNEVHCDRCTKLWPEDQLQEIHGKPVCPHCRALMDDVVVGPDVEEVAVFDRALTPEEIKMRYEEGLKRRQQND